MVSQSAGGGLQEDLISQSAGGGLRENKKGRYGMERCGRIKRGVTEWSR